MVVDVKPPKLLPTGETFVKYSPDGGSFAYYASGRMAAAYERMGAGFYAYFYADNKQGDTLIAFDPIGCGYVTFSREQGGGPRLTSQKTGGTFNHEDGSSLRRWSVQKPLDQSKPIAIDVSQHIRLTYKSRQLIHVTLSVGGLTEEYDLGDVPKMASDSYLSKAVRTIKTGPERGKVVLDIDKVRLAAQENRERREALMMTDIPVAKTNVTEDSMVKHPQLRPVVAATDELTRSVVEGKWNVDVFLSKEEMTASLSGTFPHLTLGDALQTNPLSNTLASLPTSNPEVLSALLQPSSNSTGALPLSRAIKGASGRYRPEHSRHYRTPRMRLPEIKWQVYDDTIKETHAKLVCVVCLRADMPNCRKQEVMLEELNGELLAKEAEANSEGSEVRPDVKLMKFEMQSTRKLRDRYNIHSLPMYLIYAGGKLAYASNVLNGRGTGKDDLKKQLEDTSAAVQKGNFLPDDFKFGVTDDAMTADFQQTLNKTSSGLKAR